jgi:hypothetical protein
MRLCDKGSTIVDSCSQIEMTFARVHDSEESASSVTSTMVLMDLCYTKARNRSTDATG